MLMGVLVQALQQAGTAAWRQRVPVQQRRRGLQGERLLAVENLAPVKAQGAAVGPLEAIEQQPLLEAHQNNEPGRLVRPEQPV